MGGCPKRRTHEQVGRRRVRHRASPLGPSQGASRVRSEDTVVGDDDKSADERVHGGRLARRRRLGDGDDGPPDVPGLCGERRGTRARGFPSAVSQRHRRSRHVGGHRGGVRLPTGRLPEGGDHRAAPRRQRRGVRTHGIGQDPRGRDRHHDRTRARAEGHIHNPAQGAVQPETPGVPGALRSAQSGVKDGRRGHQHRRRRCGGHDDRDLAKHALPAGHRVGWYQHIYRLIDGGVSQRR